MVLHFRIVIIDFEKDLQVINVETAEIVLAMRIVVTVEAVECPHSLEHLRFQVVRQGVYP